jgi:anti-sigma regulatory factor (Ser/Thr protein kinase)
MMPRSQYQMPAAHEDLQRIMGMVQTFCATNKVPESTCNLMNLALDEVLSNIVKYAYDPSEKGMIDVQLSYSNNILVASVEDGGIPFNPLALQTSLQEGPLHARQEGGLGIFFVKSLLDGVTYERKSDRNRITLSIRVPSE